MSKHDWLGLLAIIFMVLAMATMTGCTVTGAEIARADAYCKDHGGVQSDVHSIDTAHKVATCGCGHSTTVLYSE